MAWNRFGPQVLAGPRASTRFILVGLYGWLGLAFLLWLVARMTIDRQVGPSQLLQTVQFTGHAHLPLLVVGFVVQFVVVLMGVSGPGSVAAVFAVVVWMPLLLVAAVRHIHAISAPRSLAIVVLPYALWLLTAGRFLYLRLGHLL